MFKFLRVGLALAAFVFACELTADQQFRNSNPIVQPSLWVAVTPSNSTDLPQGITKGVYVDQPGTITFLPADNTPNATVQITVTAGTRIDGFIRRVYSTGTTATGIWALY